jgi:divalent metal cation (Fe/Co/Zn/Cd) transporter
VVVAAVVIQVTGFRAADALASMLLGVLILPRTWRLLRDAVDVLLEATPKRVDLAAVRRHIQDRQGRRWANLPAGRCKAWIVDDVRRFSFIIDSARQANGDEPHEEAAPRPSATSEQSAPQGAAARAGTSRTSPSKTSPPPDPPPDQTTRD